MKQALLVFAMTLFSAGAHAGSTLDAAIGGGIGGAAGAAIGNEVGGRDGAIVGGAIGGAMGAAVATDRESGPAPAPNVHIEAPAPRGVHCPPGQRKKGRC